VLSPRQTSDVAGEGRCWALAFTRSVSTRWLIDVSVSRRVVRFLVDDRGQDLIEYALLSGLVAAAGLVVFPEMAARMSAGYEDWVDGAHGAWEPCPPIAVGPCP